MKNSIIINLTDGLYFYDKYNSVYFVEKKYLNKSDDTMIVLMMSGAILLSAIIPYLFKTSNLNNTLSIILLVFSYGIYFSVVFFLTNKSANNNYRKKYECFKILVNVEKKKKLLQITKRGAIAYGIIFMFIVTDVVRVYYLFISKGEYDNLLLETTFLAGAFFLVLPIIINLTKFNMRLKKELTD